MNQNISASPFAGLHDESYSKMSGYYTGLTDSMRNVRKDVLSFVLDAKNQEAFGSSFIGPMRIGKDTLSSLSKESRVLDVGCATGDNLVLMKEQGFKFLTGLDLAKGMIQEARKQLDSETLVCDDFFQYKPLEKYDLVFAQAFVHLFPKQMLKEVLLRLLSFSKRRVYFSTTIHDKPSEGMESKQDVIRYRSRYSLPEILGVAKEILATDPNLSFHYFFLTDPLGKFWINAVFERQDILNMIQEDGVVVYKKLVSPEEIHKSLAELDFFKSDQPIIGTILRYDAENVFDRVENVIPYCSSHLRDLLFNEKVHGIVSFLMQEEAVLLKDKINYKLPGSGQFVPHQDAAAGWDRYGSNQLTFALSFDEATVENGALYFACGEHKKGLLSPLRTPLSEAVVKSLDWNIILMEPGDALFFDAYVPHFSNQNKSDKPRRMSFLTYNAKKSGDFRESFFIEKRKRQPPIDERNLDLEMIRDQFGKLIYK